MKKDFALLEGNFIATKEMMPVIERWGTLWLKLLATADHLTYR